MSEPEEDIMMIDTARKYCFNVGITINLEDEVVEIEHGVLWSDLEKIIEEGGDI